MNFGIENNILLPPWSLVISLLIINGLYFFGFNLAKFFFDKNKYFKINFSLSLPLSIAFISFLIFPLALLGVLERYVLQFVSISLIVYGLYKFFFYKKYFYYSFKEVFGFRAKNKNFLNKFEIFLLICFFLLSCAPITDADSINYHSAVSLHILNFGTFPKDLEWFTARLAGSGEVINSLAFSIGAEQFGSLLQFCSIASINILIKHFSIKNKKITQICSILILSSPLLASLVLSQKPMLIGIAMIIISAYIALNFLRDNDILLNNKLKIFGLIVFLLCSASTIKLNFILSSFVVGFFSLFIMLKNKILFRSFIIGIILFLICYFPFVLWKSYIFGGNIFLNLFEAFPGNQPSTEEFFHQLKKWRDSETFFPLNFIFTNRPSLITTILGIGVIVVILPIFNLQNFKSDKYRLSVVIALILGIIIYLISQKNSRFYLEVYLLLSISFLYINYENNKKILKISRYLLYFQAIATSLIILYGILFVSVGSFHYKLRQNVMMSKANGYPISLWLDRVLPKNTSLINGLGQYTSLMPRNSISNDWYGFTKNEKDFNYYYEIVRRKKPKFIVTISSTKEKVPMKEKCKIEIYAGPKLFKTVFRNPFSQNSNHPGFYIWVLEILDLEKCKW